MEDRAANKPSLNNLPNELIHLICSRLHTEANYPVSLRRDPVHYAEAIAARDGLSKLSRTCSKFRGVGQWWLYHEFGGPGCDELCRWPRESDRCKLAAPWSERGTALFLRTMLERPVRASMVRKIWIELDHVMGRIDTSPLPLQTITQACARSGILPTEPDDPWWAERKLGMLLIAFLAFLPNLEFAHFHCAPAWEDKRHPQLLPRLPPLVGRIPGCGKLKHLSIARGPTLGLRFDEVDGLLRLPTLRRFDTYRVSGRDPCGLKPASLGITQLSFRRGWMAESAMSELLHACKVLDSFRYVMGDGIPGGRDRARLYLPPVSLPQLTQLLQIHKNTLQSLELDFGSFRHDDWVNIIRGGGWDTLSVYITPRIPSLRAFTAVRHLHLHHECFMGGVPYRVPARAASLVADLPPNLEDLELIEVDSDQVKEARKLAHYDVDVYPVLKRVLLCTATLRAQADALALVPEFARAGIRLVVH